MSERGLQGGAARHPEDTEDTTGEFIHGEERDEGIGELTPLPDDAGGDTPPETVELADLEESVGRTLSDDLTAEATQLKGDESTGFGRPTGTP
jgi:hypothetical protein